MADKGGAERVAKPAGPRINFPDRWIEEPDDLNVSSLGLPQCLEEEGGVRANATAGIVGILEAADIGQDAHA